MSDEGIWRDIVRAYVEAGQGRYADALMAHRLPEGFWTSVLTLAIHNIRDSGVAAGSFVAFACRTAAVVLGRFPFPEQVLGCRALTVYLAQYRLAGADAAGAPVYRATAERLALYAARAS